jgi:hypothetical protein
MKSIFLALVLFLICVFNAYAGTTTGSVNLVYVHGYNDTILFNMESTAPNYAACATTNRYAVSTTSQQGKNILASILTAKTSGQTITVVGTDACTTHGDSEDISYLLVN